MLWTVFGPLLLAQRTWMALGASPPAPADDDACAIFDKSSSSAWGGVHDRAFEKDNDTPESITIDGNTYTASASFEHKGEDWQTSSGSSSQHWISLFKLKRAAGRDSGTESGWSGLYVTLTFPVPVVTTAVYGGYGAIDMTPKPDGGRFYLGATEQVIQLCAGGNHYAGECPRSVTGPRATADQMATLQVHGLRRAPLAAGESHLSVMDVKVRCEGNDEHAQRMWTRVSPHPPPPPLVVMHSRRQPPPPPPLMARVRVSSTPPPPPSSNGAYSYSVEQAYGGEYHDDDTDYDDAPQGIARGGSTHQLPPLVAGAARVRTSSSTSSSMSSSTSSVHSFSSGSRGQLPSPRFELPLTHTSTETADSDELLGFNVFLAPPSPSAPPVVVSGVQWGLIANFLGLDTATAQVVVVGLVGALLVVVAKAYQQRDEQRRAGGRPSRLAAVAPEDDDDDDVDHGMDDGREDDDDEEDGVEEQTVLPPTAREERLVRAARAAARDRDRGGGGPAVGAPKRVVPPRQRGPQRGACAQHSSSRLAAPRPPAGAAAEPDGGELD